MSSRLDSALAPVIGDEQTYTQTYEVQNTPNGLVRMGGATAIGLLLIGLVVAVLVSIAGVLLSLVIPAVPWAAYPAGSLLGTTLLAVVKYWRATSNAMNAAVDGYATWLYAVKTQADAQHIRAEAERIKAQADLAAAQPPVIEHRQELVPVQGPASRPMVRNPAHDAEYFRRTVQAPETWECEGIVYRREDIKEFIRRCLPDDPLDKRSKRNACGRVKHGRRYWTMLAKGDTVQSFKARTMLPSGVQVNTAEQHKKYLAPLLFFKMIQGYGGQDGDNANDSGEWLLTDSEEIFQFMRL